MKSHFNGCGIGDTKLHMIHYFDGQRVREIELMTKDGIIIWTENTAYGMLEVGKNYRNALRVLKRYETRCTMRA